MEKWPARKTQDMLHVGPADQRNSPTARVGAGQCTPLPGQHKGAPAETPHRGRRRTHASDQIRQPSAPTHGTGAAEPTTPTAAPQFRRNTSPINHRLLLPRPSSERRRHRTGAPVLPRRRRGKRNLFLPVGWVATGGRSGKEERSRLLVLLHGIRLSQMLAAESPMLVPDSHVSPDSPMSDSPMFR